jgi:hypothetical protein
VGAVLVASATVLHADPPDLSIKAHVLATGTSARSGSSCFRLTATVGEPVAGFSASASGEFTLSGGFRAMVPSQGDDLFFSGFESCTP